MPGKTDSVRLLEYLADREQNGLSTTRTRARREFDWDNAKIGRELAALGSKVEAQTWGYLQLAAKGPASIKTYGDESQLYAPIVAALKIPTCAWLQRKHFSTVFPFNTSARRATKADPQLGKWSNPDITLVFFHRLDFHRQDLLEVMTFEVKHASKQLDITAVYEALAHRRGATMSYLFVYCEPGIPLDDQLKEVLCKEAGKHGIGVITASNLEDSKTWEELLSARRVDTDPYDVEAFLAAKLNDDEQKQIRTLTVR